MTIEYSTKNLVLLDTTIRQDEMGRFFLNDLHKASGGEVKNRPAVWLQNQQTIDLAKECEIDGIPSILAKQGLGTFVVKDLVYAYAMWISPTFHLKVIRAYDAMVAYSVPRSFADALQLAADQARVIEEKDRLLEHQAPAVAFHKQVTENSETLLRIEEACALLKRKTGQDFNQTTWLRFLREQGIAKLQNKHSGIGPKMFVPKAAYVNRWFVSTMTDGGNTLWLVRPVAVEQIFQMIEQQRAEPYLLPPPVRQRLARVTSCARNLQFLTRGN
jgi:phage antirepressor YoqD-like protein